MKKVILLAMSIAALMVCGNVDAQTRKDKKAAQKAKWEMEQQQQQEEAALRHQLKMDSIANAAKVAEENARKEELKAQAEADAAAQKARNAEMQALQQEIAIENIPCVGEEFNSNSEYIRASGFGESMQQQVAKQKARTATLQELAGKISTTLEAMGVKYTNSESINMEENLSEKYENMVKEVVNQTTGYATLCEKYTSYTNPTTMKKVFKCYLCLQISRQDIIKNTYDKLLQEQAENLDKDYNAFENKFNKQFEQQEAQQ